MKQPATHKKNHNRKDKLQQTNNENITTAHTNIQKTYKSKREIKQLRRNDCMYV